MKIKIIPYIKGNKKGIDVVIRDDKATVGDYIRALEQYILAGDFFRFQDERTGCEGCDVCCRERVPLTGVDVLRLKDSIAPGMSLQDFFKRFCYVVVSGRVVDISLSRDYDEKCICLDKTAGKCLYYQERPLVCRTYICTLSSPGAVKLREEVVNAGMDELVRLWFEQGKKGEPVIHEAANPAVREEDWTESVWTGRVSFDEIPLREILTADLWEELRRTEGEAETTG